MNPINKLFVIHCGFYDLELSGGIYESHCNFFVVAQDMNCARLRAKQLPQFQKKKMHIDGIQQIEIVEGFRLDLIADESVNGESSIISYRHRDLAASKEG